MVATMSEFVWLKSLLATLGVFPLHKLKLFCDSQVVMHIAKNPVFQKHTKYIEVDCHFVRERLISGNLLLSYLKSQEQPTNIFTKALGTKQFLHLIDKLGMINPHAPT